jgi:nicotinamidase-related amidase
LIPAGFAKETLMLIDAEKSTLLVVDIQQKLLPAITDGATVLANACWLVDVARQIGVPVMASEQYPRGIGATVA